MELNLPEISLQQTHDLLNLVETTLQGICCRKFADKELYVEALQKVLGNSSKRGPESVFIVFSVPGSNSLRGRVFYLNGYGGDLCGSWLKIWSTTGMRMT